MDPRGAIGTVRELYVATLEVFAAVKKNGNIRQHIVDYFEEDLDARRRRSSWK